MQSTKQDGGKLKNVIFIPGNVPSSKNSKQIINVGGSSRLIWSKVAREYKKKSKSYFDLYRDPFIQLTEKLDKPYRIGFHFIRDSRRKYDWVNPVQTMLDLMVDNGWIEDDNVDIIFPFPSKYYGQYTTYDKRRPGVRIKINPNAKTSFKLH